MQMGEEVLAHAYQRAWADECAGGYSVRKTVLFTPSLTFSRLRREAESSDAAGLPSPGQIQERGQG
jgi:hypothetical protein